MSHHCDVITALRLKKEINVHTAICIFWNGYHRDMKVRNSLILSASLEVVWTGKLKMFS
jgi:hypothetical protein